MNDSESLNDRCWLIRLKTVLAVVLSSQDGGPAGGVGAGSGAHAAILAQRAAASHPALGRRQLRTAAAAFLLHYGGPPPSPLLPEGEACTHVCTPLQLAVMPPHAQSTCLRC